MVRSYTLTSIIFASLLGTACREPCIEMYPDTDMDGYGAQGSDLECAWGNRNLDGYSENNLDCDDSNPNANLLTNWYLDNDADNFGDLSSVVNECYRPDGHVVDSTDCNDNNASIYPTSLEICNGVDDNCDGQIDEGVPKTTWYLDNDGDGFGDLNSVIVDCIQPEGYVLDNTDCYDNSASIYPGASEYCNNIDDDCNTQIDDEALDVVTGYLDNDGDGYGNLDNILESCNLPSGYVLNSTDCDDDNSSINPGSPEFCNGIDDDCDIDIDENIIDLPWYFDADGDGFGDLNSVIVDCIQPFGYVLENTDCDDTDPSVSPTADEYCNTIDDNCNTLIDDNAIDRVTGYLDNDSDGFGDFGNLIESCTLPPGYVLDGTDCVDNNSNIYPGALELCNSLDDDCDTQVDEDIVSNTWYRDNDGDSYGDLTNLINDCNQPLGYVLDGTDCNDFNSDVYPGAPETCNSIDENCNGLVDDNATDMTTYYADTDSDAFGDLANTLDACGLPSGYLTNSDDCNDNNSSINPNAAETCNDYVDNNCNGKVDRDNDLLCLSSADSKLLGESSGDNAGYAVAGAGDINNDGLEDILVGSPFWNGMGAAYLVHGGVSGDIDLTSSDARFRGTISGSEAGSSVAGVGDISGDGNYDIAIGARSENLVYVLNGPVTGDITLNTSDAILQGIDQFGYSVAFTGDVNGDSQEDLFVGAPTANSVGAAYLFHGPLSGNISHSSADSVFNGVNNNDHAGESVACIGDTDGDGETDVVVGSPFSSATNVEEGAAYVLLGPFGSVQNLATADAHLTGEDGGNDAGISVAGPGDVDGDGKDDVLIGAATEDTGGNNAGAAYLVSSPVNSSISLASADAKIFGVNANGYIGSSVSGAGDVDGDGLEDILLAGYAAESSGAESGASFLMYGPVSGTIDVTATDVRIVAENSGDWSGFSVAGVGDTDGDSKSDLLIGVPRDDASGNNAGSASLFLSSGL